MRNWRETGQAMPLVLCSAGAVVFAALLLSAIGGAVTGKGRVQRAADLAALSAARSMRDDFDRLLAPARLADGTPNPRHLSKASYLARAVAAGEEAAGANGVEPHRVAIEFPDQESFAPVRARAEVGAVLEPDAVPGSDASRRAGTIAKRVELEATATAEASAPSGYGGMPETATGGGYSGPLVYRQGKPMRPDVAAAFDRMAAAAHGAGIALTINSAFRSDAEQARALRRPSRPDLGRTTGPVAPPLRDRARPGPAGGIRLARGERRALRLPQALLLGAVALRLHARSGAVLRRRRRDRERRDRGGRARRQAPSGGLPAYVPAQFRAPLERSAARWNVSAALLAAQIMAESNFNPLAVSPAGAQGIAQFMPATAAGYGLHDPFDAPAAIDAQAHLMSDLLRQFGSIPLALAAYNAGSGAVAACNCVPPYPETKAYVARILGLLDGAGEILAPPSRCGWWRETIGR